MSKRNMTIFVITTEKKVSEVKARRNKAKYSQTGGNMCGKAKNKLYDRSSQPHKRAADLDTKAQLFDLRFVRSWTCWSIGNNKI